MPLSAEQTKKLHAAILSGFSGNDLEQLARFELNERLDSLVPAGALSDVVLKLIDWAEKQGRVEDLVRAVQRARPANKEIQKLAGSLLTAAATEPAPAAGTAELDGPRRARLRAALLDQFPTRNALAMLVDDSLSVNLKTVSEASNLTEVVFELIQWASIDKRKHLQPLLAAAVRERPGSRELAALRTELFGG
jgi:hypothetical protein